MENQTKSIIKIADKSLKTWTNNIQLLYDYEDLELQFLQ
jgi:hypothetical protein